MQSPNFQTPGALITALFIPHIELLNDPSISTAVATELNKLQYANINQTINQATTLIKLNTQSFNDLNTSLSKYKQSHSMIMTLDNKSIELGPTQQEINTQCTNIIVRFIHNLLLHITLNPSPDDPAKSQFNIQYITNDLFNIINEKEHTQLESSLNRLFYYQNKYLKYKTKYISNKSQNNI